MTTKIDAKWNLIFQTFNAFFEGPIVTPDGTLIFSDLENGHFYRMESGALQPEWWFYAGNIAMAGEQATRRKWKVGCDGLALRDGNIVACQLWRGQVVEIEVNGSDKPTKGRVIVDSHGGNRFVAPNDVTVDKSGGIYFSDPQLPWWQCIEPQKMTAVYHVPKGAAKAKRVIEWLITDLSHGVSQPNGVAMSLDKQQLIVVQSDERAVVQYDVSSSGKLQRGPFGDLVKRKGGDGIAIRDNGEVFVATKRGVEAFSKEGNHLGYIQRPWSFPFSTMPANLVFIDHNTLIITAYVAYGKIASVVYQVEL